MIIYEVFIVGEQKLWLVFESAYAFHPNERLFLEKEGVNYSLNITKITHNLESGSHVVRLNCHARPYEEK